MKTARSYVPRRRSVPAAVLAAALLCCSAMQAETEAEEVRLVIKPVQPLSLGGAEDETFVPPTSELNCRWRNTGGLWSLIADDDRLVAQGTYRNGLRHGKWVRHFGPGEGEMFAQDLYRGFEPPFASEAEFVDGKIHGRWTVYDAQRRKASQWDFADDLPHGKSRWWLPDGRLRQEIDYDRGQMHGRLLLWDENQRLIAAVDYAEGKRVTRHVAQPAEEKPGCQGWYLHPGETSNHVLDWWNGIAKTTLVVEPLPPQRHGRWTWWHNSSQKRVEGTYNEGRPEGTFTWWYETGERQLQGRFADGEQEGTFTWWYPTGQKHIEGEFAAGTENGVWRTWRPDGRVAATGEAGYVLKEAARFQPAPLQLPSDEPEPARTAIRPLR